MASSSSTNVGHSQRDSKGNFKVGKTALSSWQKMSLYHQKIRQQTLTTFSIFVILIDVLLDQDFLRQPIMIDAK